MSLTVLETVSFDKDTHFNLSAVSGSITFDIGPLCVGGRVSQQLWVAAIVV